MDKFADVLNLAENTSRGVDVGDGDGLVLLLLQCLLDLIELWAVANGGLELSGLDTVRLETVCEAVGKVTGVEDEDIIARLDQVGGDLVPAEGAGSRDDKRLGGGIFGLEELPEHLESLAEGLDKGCSDVGLAVVQYASVMGSGKTRD